MSERQQVVVANPFGEDTETPQRATGALISVEQQRAIAEVQARMIIARSNPRDPLRAVDMILEDCRRPSLAEAALYSYARGGTSIEGPSIQLLQAIARRWGNLASGVREISRRGEYSECVAYAWDLESGYYDERFFQVRHWRDTRSGGYRLTDERDIYEAMMNSGQRRKRAALEAVIPGDVVQAAIEQCEQTLRAKADTSPEGIKRMLATFATIGVTKEQIETRCQCRAEAIRPAQLVHLRKIVQSIRDGMSDPNDWFPAPDGATAEPAKKRGNTALRETMRAAKAAPTEPEPAPSTHDEKGGHAQADDLADQNQEMPAREDHPMTERERMQDELRRKQLREMAGPGTVIDTAGNRLTPADMG